QNAPTFPFAAQPDAEQRRRAQQHKPKSDTGTASPRVSTSPYPHLVGIKESHWTKVQEKLALIFVASLQESRIGLAEEDERCRFSNIFNHWARGGPTHALKTRPLHRRACLCGAEKGFRQSIPLCWPRYNIGGDCFAEAKVAGWKGGASAPP